MEPAEKKRRAQFVGVLAFLTLTINVCFLINSYDRGPASVASPIQSRPAETLYHPSPPAQPAAIQRPGIPAKKAEDTAAAKAAEEHRKFLERYLNRTSPRNAGTTTVAIVVASETGSLNNALATALADHFKSSGAEISTSLFTLEFISDGLFDSLLGGSSQVFNQLELAKLLNTLLLAKQTVEYSTNPDLENTTTARMRLDVTVLSATERGQSRSWSFSSSGIGFSEMQARAMAEDRIVKQIQKGTTMKLEL